MTLIKQILKKAKYLHRQEVEINQDDKVWLAFNRNWYQLTRNQKDAYMKYAKGLII
tara:strand:- start:319 stop:486 length:168 start_codon:yes stop_codon:yes gene_type:complete